MRIVIIGSVAAGTSVAAKARRNSEDNEIVIYEKDSDISYSGCGLPYYIGNDYISRDNLTPRDPKWFKKRFDIDIFTKHEVLEIDKVNKKVRVKNLLDNTIKEDSYDKLVIATGAKPIVPKIEGIGNGNVFCLRNVQNADEIENFIVQNKPKNAVIIGSGYIGLEMLENLKNRNIDVTMIEKEKRVMPSLDEDISIYIEDYLDKQKVNYILGESVERIDENFIITNTGQKIEADLVISAIGIKPNTDLAKKIGINTEKNGAVIVNEKMQTNIDGIYAVGDCALTYLKIDGRKTYIPLGSTANKMGRIAGDLITGGDLNFRGILGTGIFKIFDLAVARTGLTEKQVIESGYDYEVVHNIKENQSKYLSESRQIVIKAIADKKSEKLLGVQIVGERGVDKRIDVFATAMTLGAKVSDLFHLDLAYAPPFSTTKDPVMYTGMILDNAINKDRKILKVDKLIENREKYIVIDVRSEKDFNKGHIENAIHIPLAELRERYVELNKSDNIVVHCNKGVTGNAAQNLLINLGFENVYNLSGGYKNYKMQMQRY